MKKFINFYKNFSSCMAAEKRRFIYDGQNHRNMNQQIEFMLEKKRKEKLLNNDLKIEDVNKSKENDITNSNIILEKEYFVRNNPQIQKEKKMEF
jgi:mevalonate pyrophosphate decarboxylase